MAPKAFFLVNESRQNLEYIGQPAVKSEIPLEGRKFYEDSQGNLWVGFNRRFGTIHQRTEVLPYSHRQKWARCILSNWNTRKEHWRLAHTEMD